MVNAVVGNTDSASLGLGQLCYGYRMLIDCNSLSLLTFCEKHTSPGVNDGNIVVNLDQLLVSGLEREEVIDLLV